MSIIPLSSRLFPFGIRSIFVPRVQEVNLPFRKERIVCLVALMSLLQVAVQAQDSNYRKHCDSISFYSEELQNALVNHPYRTADSILFVDTVTWRGVLDSMVFYFYPDGQICYEKYWLERDFYLKTDHGYARYVKNRYGKSLKEVRAENRYNRKSFCDSIVCFYYPNGQLCFEKRYRKGKCRYFEAYYSNGHPYVRSWAAKGSVYPIKESFPCDYGDYIYQYGFKVKKRSYLSYNFDGSISYLAFKGRYRHQNVRIDIHFVCGELSGAWIYNRQNRLIAQFDWNKKSQTWGPAAVNHVLSKREDRYRARMWRKKHIRVIT